MYGVTGLSSILLMMLFISGMATVVTYVIGQKKLAAIFGVLLGVTVIFSFIFLMMFIGRVPMTQMGKLVGGVVILVAIFLTMVFTLPICRARSETSSQKGMTARL